MTYAKIKPAVNQIQIYPECAQPELVKWLFNQNIMPVAYSPVGRMGQRHGSSKFECIDHPLVLDLAAKYGRTPV